MLKPLLSLAALTAVCVALSGQTTTSSEQLEKHVYTLASDSLLGRGFGTEQGSKAAAYIAEQFREAGVEPLNGSYIHPFIHRMGILNIKGNNVAGIIRGNDPALQDEYVILGAHFDHLGWKRSGGDTVVYNGADDNASGTASIIEIGRNLAAKREFLGRSVILVAFDGEESGLIGSKYFLRDSVVPLYRIKLMFSLDMVGMYEAHKGLDLHGIERLYDSETLIGRMADSLGITVRRANKRIVQRTDTAPFGELEIPAVHAFTGTESPYHQPGDEADKLDYEGMALIADYLTEVTLETSGKPRISDLQGPAKGETLADEQKTVRLGFGLASGPGRHIYVDEFYEGKSVFAAEAGLMFNIRALRYLTIQPELLYETKGSEHEAGTFRTHSVTAPLNFLVTTPSRSGARSYLQMGAYYSYHFAGKLGQSPIDFSERYHEQEFGLTYGFGIEVMNFQWGVHVRRGLTNLLQDPDGGVLVNRNVYVRLGLLF